MLTSNKYNVKRKALLQKLDKKEHVSVIDLGMYDLTTYFKDSFDVSLAEAILLNKNLERPIEHINENAYWAPPQIKALTMLEQETKVILSAPTSFGKTLLVKEFIYRNKPSKIVFIVPTNALAYELEKSFKYNENFNDYIIFDKVTDTNDIDNNSLEKQQLLFIGTQEKFLEISDESFKKIDLFVIDEAYKLEESIRQQRGYKLSEAFLTSISRKSKKTFLLTPQAIFKGFDKFEFKTFETNFNAVEKQFILLKVDEFYKSLLQKCENEKTILFCETPNQINETYKTIETNLQELEITNFVNQIEKDIHPDWSVVKLLKSGILTHHGQMPKYVQNKMISLFNSKNNYNLLLGTNSISEGINTTTKNLFIHPDYNNYKNILLIKNTVGRAGRLGEYPMGHIFSVEKIESLLSQDIEITLSVSNEDDVSEIENSKNEDKILDLSNEYEMDFKFCKEILKTHSISLSKLKNILDSLKIDRKYDDIANLPYIALKSFPKDYTTSPQNDCILIKGYLQSYYLDDNSNRIYINTFNDQIVYYKKQKDKERTKKEKKSKRKLAPAKPFDNSQVINQYMQFIYSTLEYYIIPVVNIGLEIEKSFPNWKFGKNVIKSLEKCRSKYYNKTFGYLDVENLTETHVKIISALKDYGMYSSVKNLNIEILDEISGHLNIRYSTIDVLNAIERLSRQSKNHQSFYLDIKKKYID